MKLYISCLATLLILFCSCKQQPEFDTVKIGENLLECHVKIKGTINGRPVNIDVTFTSDSGSCIKDTVKLLKDLAAEM